LCRAQNAIAKQDQKEQDWSEIHGQVEMQNATTNAE
jgi:hypothetical protein